jgi:hypothetical protein
MSRNAPPTKQAETDRMMRMSTVCSSLPMNGEATVIVRYITVTYMANAVVSTPRPSATTGWNRPHVEKHRAEHPKVIMMPVRTTSIWRTLIFSFLATVLNLSS